VKSSVRFKSLNFFDKKNQLI